MKGNLLFCFIILFSSSALMAHGTGANRIDGGVGVVARYDDGSPMSYCDVKVFSPSGGAKPFQEGLTDKNGGFLFAPDENGEWRIVIDDGMGHSIAEEVVVGAGSRAVMAERPVVPRYLGILMGICVIFGMAGIAFYLTAKRKGE